MTSLLERFLTYVKLDTQSDEHATTSPSTAKQLVLSKLLADECRALKLSDVTMSENGIVMATVPSNVSHPTPVIGLIAHVDTSSEYSGTNVNPHVYVNYAGGDIILKNSPDKVITVENNPVLKELIGKTLVTTDGTTLLGADDKSGIAAIMHAAQHLMQHPEVTHGDVRLCFTVDEEIGRGTHNLDLQQLGCNCAYTLDSEGTGRIDSETFSADLAIVQVDGINTHPSEGKGKMVNAVRILSDFINQLPQDRLAPEVTDEREGFMHPYAIEGSVAHASVRIILRDFETPALSEQAAMLKAIGQKLEAKYPRCQVTVTIKEQYRNMRDGLHIEPRAIPIAVQAHENLKLPYRKSIVRGGTDGSLLTALGLPTPNLSTGQHNVHSPLEWTCVEEMETAASVLVEIARLWSQQPLNPT
jgi:tripeptide aminopeptidase